MLSLQRGHHEQHRYLMDIMIEGQAVEDLKLPISSLGIPGFQEHLPHAMDFSRNGFAERVVDETANGAAKEGPNDASKELISSRAASMNGFATEKSAAGGLLCIDMGGTPSPQSDKFANEQRLDVLKQEETPQSDEKETSHRQGNWVYAEILVLLEAKAKEYEFPRSEFKRSRLSADDKWKQVSEYCKNKGVQRTKEQCKVKWDNMMPDYRKVRDYEEQKDMGAPSYFEMDVWGRRMKLLPSNMDAEIYHRIASIQSNKPAKGGLKREAREKRPLELSQMFMQSSQPITRLSNGAEGMNGVNFEGERPRLADLVGKHIASLAPRKRKRRRAPEIAFHQEKTEPVAKMDLRMDPAGRTDLQIHDDSSTEDDAAVVSSRSQQGTPLAVGMFAERTSFLTAHQRSSYESRDTLPDIRRPLQQALHQQGSAVMVERGNGNSVLEGASAKGAKTDIGQNQEVTTLVEDRKDARHRELMALEREKLAVFREATFAIANAMTNAMAVFSKVAEELLLRRG